MMNIGVVEKWICPMAKDSVNSPQLRMVRLERTLRTFCIQSCEFLIQLGNSGLKL